MKQTNYRAQILSTLQADHKIISYGVDSFNRLLNGERTPGIAQQFADVQQLIGDKLETHFAYEEEKVFKTLLADHPGERTTRLITELCQEHATLLERGQEVSALLRGHNPDNCSNQLWTVAINYLLDLDKHAAKENQLLALFASAN